MKNKTEKLRVYFYGLTPEEREKFASNCETTVGHIVHIINNRRNCNPSVAISMERESNRAIICNDLCPGADFDFLRKTVKQVA